MQPDSVRPSTFPDAALLNLDVAGSDVAHSDREILPAADRPTGELERWNDALEQFAATSSHDLREPLRKLRAYGIGLLGTPGALPTAEGRDHVERMIHAATRMQVLIDELLALAQVSVPERLDAIDAGAMVREVLRDLDATITHAGAVVSVGTLPMVTGDPAQVRQLFRNLIANALTFRREDARPSITLEEFVPRGADANRGQLRGICVRDNGIGFDIRDAEVIFEPLKRLHGRSRYSGSGMGLARSRRIVERHGGTIRAEGVAGQGSRFCLTLPGARSSSARRTTAA